VRGNRQANTKAKHAGFFAALFGKTLVKAGFPKYDLPPAEFFILLFYTLHNGEVVLENVILDIKPMSAFRS